MVWIGFINPHEEPREISTDERAHVGRRVDDAWEQEWESDLKPSDGLDHFRWHLAEAGEGTSRIVLVLGQTEFTNPKGKVEYYAWMACRQARGKTLLWDEFGDLRGQLQRGERISVRLPVRIEVRHDGQQVCNLWAARARERLDDLVADSRARSAAISSSSALRSIGPTLQTKWDIDQIYSGGPRSWQYAVLMGISIRLACVQAGRFGHVVSRNEVLAALNRHRVHLGSLKLTNDDLTTLYREVRRELGMLGTVVGDLKDMAHRSARVAVTEGWVHDNDVRKFWRKYEADFGSLAELSHEVRSRAGS